MVNTSEIGSVIPCHAASDNREPMEPSTMMMMWRKPNVTIDCIAWKRTTRLLFSTSTRMSPDTHPPRYASVLATCVSRPVPPDLSLSIFFPPTQITFCVPYQSMSKIPMLERLGIVARSQDDPTGYNVHPALAAVVKTSIAMACIFGRALNGCRQPLPVSA